MDHYISFPNKSILLTKRDNPIEKVWHNQGFWQKTNKYRYFISFSIFTWIKILIGGKKPTRTSGENLRRSRCAGKFPFPDSKAEKSREEKRRKNPLKFYIAEEGSRRRIGERKTLGYWTNFLLFARFESRERV